jgi:RimJ/RimL family protein N-acetyltransferase
MPNLAPLGQAALIHERVRLEPLSDQHLEPLRTACAQDPDIWEIYPVSMLGEHFDPAAAFLISDAGRPGFAVIDRQAHTVVGMTRFINPDEHGVVEIGGTYIAPSVRGTGFNAVMKTLLLDHAFDCGYRKVEFRVDTRNTRSMAAVLKLGATQEGVLRKNRITWTGYERDTAVFGLLREEWRGEAER